ncbi:MAG TPA: hypothetical protein VIS96_17875 [Terrimicrobiaceae bacterium]
MQSFLDRILTLNLICTTVIFAVAARLYILPNLPRWKIANVLVPILLLHSLRHLGMMFLTPGAIYAGMPLEFAYPAALGDFITAILAFAAIPLVLKNPIAAKPLLWFVNVFGTIDLITAISLATIFQAPLFMGPSYWIPAFWVPSLLVTHYIMFRILVGDPRLKA